MPMLVAEEERACAENLQDGKFARFNNEEWCEHQTNAGSKHNQGSQQKATKDQESVPPTH
jgi:hypothetical protein